MLKSVTTTTGFSIIIQFAGLISGVLIARMLGAEGRGELAVILMWPTIIATAGLLGVDVILARKSSEYESFDAKLYGIALFYSLILGILYVFIMHLTLPFLLSGEKIYLLPLAKKITWYIPFSLLTVYLCSIMLGRGDIKRYNYFRLLFSPIYIITLLALFTFYDVDVGDIVHGFILSTFLTGVLLFVYSQKNCRKTNSKPFDKINILKEGFSFGVSSIIYALSTQLPFILLAAFVDVKAIGFFAVAYVVSTVHMPFGNAIGKVLFSEAALSSNSGADSGPYRFRLILLIYIFVALLTLLLAPLLLSVLYGPGFSDAIPMLNYLIPATCIMVVTNIMDETLKGYGISRPGILARLTGILILISVGYLFIGAMGTQGVLYALLIKSLIEFYVISDRLASFYKVSNVVLFRYKMDDIVYLKKILKIYSLKS